MANSDLESWRQIEWIEVVRCVALRHATASALAAGANGVDGVRGWPLSAIATVKRMCAEGGEDCCTAKNAEIS